MRRPQRCPACFENGRDPAREHRPVECRAYLDQIAFNKRMRRLLADQTPWYARPVPESPDYSDHWGSGPLGAALRYSGTGAAAWVRETYAALATNGAAYKRLRAAIVKAESAQLTIPTGTQTTTRRSAARKAA